MSNSATSTGPAPRYASPVDYDTYGPGRGFDKGTSFQCGNYALHESAPLVVSGAC